MTTLAELEALVVTLTKRPDKSADIMQAIRMQTLKLHRLNFFKSDLTANVVALAASPDNLYTVNLSTDLIRSRYIEAVMDYKSNGYGSTDFERLDASNIFGSYNLEKQNYFYVMGNELKIKSYVELTSVRILHYQYPVTSEVAYASWIADRYPDIVAEAAAAEIFKSIGKDDEASKYKQSAILAARDILKDEVG